MEKLTNNSGSSPEFVQVESRVRDPEAKEEKLAREKKGVKVPESGKYAIIRRFFDVFVAERSV